MKQSNWIKFTIANGTETLQTHKERALHLLWTSVFTKLEQDQLFLIPFKICSTDGSYRSISFVQALTKNDLDSAIVIFNEFLNLKQENYESLQVKDILFVYRLVKPNSKITSKAISLSPVSINKDKPPFSIQGYN